MLSITLDWLAFTFKEDTFDAGLWIRTYASDKGATSIAATNGYRTAYRSIYKVDVMWNTDRPEMGYHVIIAGTAIRNICEHMELDQKTLLVRCAHAGASFTRIDLAKDLTGTKFAFDEIYKEMELGNRTGTARNIAQIHSLNGGNTIYVGSRQSEKFIRIYDKAAQSGIAGQLWARFELEIKGVVSRSLAHILVGGGSWSSAFDTIARHMCDLAQSRDWLKFFDTDEPSISFPKIEKQANREKWIETQVISAVAKHFIENPDSDAVRSLRATLDFIARPQTDEQKAHRG